MDPRYPIYVISKGRHESRLTVRALQEMGVPFSIVIEPQEFEQYAAVIDPHYILVLPFSNLGQGSIPARNWVWKHATDEGHKRHWILDDNITEFYRLNRHHKIRFRSGAAFRIMEDFVDRYCNIPMAGPQYESLQPRNRPGPPFILNTRVYSCILLSNEEQFAAFRWRGRYNEDTDLSLRFLKRGYCTVLFCAVLAKKIATMRMKGGNTDELYRQDAAFDGRLEMAKSLQQQHPDVTRIARRWGRWQHVVDYRKFKHNQLEPMPGITIPHGVNEYGLVQVSLDDLRVNQ